MGIRMNNKCSFCPDKIDFVEHFFYECSAIHPIWERITNKVFQQYNVNIKIDVQTALLGYMKTPGMSNNLVNYINLLIIVAKMCVGKFKYGKPIEIVCMFNSELDLRHI
eukprot:GHVL01034892.1.p1 GENE.GHVL01034892.1~~GHVL01034892.1.p1  ORF type:complete len:109 (-),score=6.87 GHVL01034892.1:316-642(-)